MSTRSQIILMAPDESIQCIYCHSDGYLTWNGAALLQHFATLDKVQDLIALGDLSCIYLKTGNVTAYMRDRGQTGQEATSFDNLEAFIEKYGFENYNYVFGPDGKWYWFIDSELDSMKPLTPEAIDAYRKEQDARLAAYNARTN